MFRLYYYIIPLFLAGALFAGNEMLLRGGALLQVAAAARGVQALARWSEPDFAVAAATGAVALCGVLLLVRRRRRAAAGLLLARPGLRRPRGAGRPVRARP